MNVDRKAVFNDTGSMVEEAIQLLGTAYLPDELVVENQSERHRGHAGYKEGQVTHLSIQIKAPYFGDLSRVQAHRDIHKTLASLFDQGLHALQLSISA